MAGARTVEEILARGGGELFASRCSAPNPVGNYNRILLSSMLDGTQSEEGVLLNPPAWYAENGITLHAGVRAARIQRYAKCVLGADGTAEPYDKLIIATGSRPTFRRSRGLSGRTAATNPASSGFARSTIAAGWRNTPAAGAGPP